MDYNNLIPELAVTDLEQSKTFYLDLLGFKVDYERPEDKFLFLSFESSQLMIEELSDDEKIVLPKTLGRGVNFTLTCSDIQGLYDKILKANYPIHQPMMTREFRVNDSSVLTREFALLDPDGYHFRFND